MATGGISNHDMLKVSTIQGAYAIGLDKQLGSLEEGKLADIVILGKDPLIDIRNTNFDSNFKESDCKCLSQPLSRTSDDSNFVV